MPPKHGPSLTTPKSKRDGVSDISTLPSARLSFAKHLLGDDCRSIVHLETINRTFQPPRNFKSPFQVFRSPFTTNNAEFKHPVMLPTNVLVSWLPKHPPQKTDIDRTYHRVTEVRHYKSPSSKVNWRITHTYGKAEDGGLWAVIVHPGAVETSMAKGNTPESFLPRK